MDHHGLSHGFTDEVLWLRFTLHNRERDVTLSHLEVGFPQLDDVRLFWQQDGQWHSDRNGDSVPVASRSLQTRLPGFLLRLRPDETRDIFIRVKSTSALAMPIAVASPARLLQHHEQRNIQLGIFYGISIAAIFMAAIFYLLLRESVFLHFLLFILCVTGVMLCLDGIGFLFWHGLARWQQYAIIHFEALAGIFGILFAKQFLNATATPAFFGTFYRGMIAWFVICMVAALAIPFPAYVQMVAFACLLLIPVMFVHGMSLALQRDRPAIIFTAGWSGFFVIGALSFINNLGYAHHMDVSLEYFRLGFEIVMLANKCFPGGFVFDAEIQVCHPDQLLHVGATNQCAAKHHDLPFDIGLHGQARHQGLKNGLGVDKNSGRSFVLVRNAQDRDCSNCANQPGCKHP